MTKLQKLMRPNCGAKLNYNTTGQKEMFCGYCGEKFLVDDGKTEHTINKNINITKETTNRYVDEAEVIKAKTADREAKKRMEI